MFNSFFFFKDKYKSINKKEISYKKIDIYVIIYQRNPMKKKSENYIKNKIFKLENRKGINIETDAAVIKKTDVKKN